MTIHRKRFALNLNFLTTNRALSHFFTHIMHSEWSIIIPFLIPSKPYICNNQQYKKNKAKRIQEANKKQRETTLLTNQKQRTNENFKSN